MATKKQTRKIELTQREIAKIFIALAQYRQMMDIIPNAYGEPQDPEFKASFTRLRNKMELALYGF
jgi:hypothetical protein